jgi:hypothetical protein
LQKLPLKHLDIQGTRVPNVRLLRGLPLEWLDISSTPITSLAGLEDMLTLKKLQAPGGITSAEPLRRLRLRELSLFTCPIESVEVLGGMKELRYLDISFTRVTDISPLADLPLERFFFDRVNLPPQQYDTLLKMTHLREISVSKGQKAFLPQLPKNVGIRIH